MDVWPCICYVTAFLVYLNTLTADFVYDDRRAILSNQDVNSKNAFYDLWKNDFWGTPLASTNSHGSYRPLCVLTFRLNHWLFGYQPWGYHLTNVLLHVISTSLVLKMAKQLLPFDAAHVAALLFAVHPIHVEAVAGLVGRADIMACIFYLLTILCYMQHTDTQQFRHHSPSHASKMRPKKSLSPFKSDSSGSEKCVMAAENKCDFGSRFYRSRFFRNNLFLCMAILFATLASFSKETAFVALPVCLVYEMLLLNRAQVSRYRKKSRWKNLEILAVSTITLCLIRIQLSGFSLPSFSKADNPIAKSNFFTRLFTFLYLPVFNFKLFLFPHRLSFDWGMDSVPLISSTFDSRNCLSILFYLLLHISIKRAYTLTATELSCRLPPNWLRLFLMCLVVIPYVPTSNLLFYVGFVAAERVLYMPSVGLCLLVGYGYHLLPKKFVCTLLLTIFIIICGTRTVLRNVDWQNEENLYKSGISINPPKAYGNLGSVLSDAGRLAEAEVAFRMALKYRFNMADVHYNLAMLLEKTRRPNEAIISYNLAIKFRPSLAVAYLKLGQLLLSMNREEEAKQLLHNCSKLDGNGLKDPKVHEITKIEAMIKLAGIESKNGYHQNALSIYMQAIVSAPTYYKPQALYNWIGKTLIKMEKYEEAGKWFRYVIGEREFERREFLDLNSFVNNSKVEKQEWLNILKRNQKFNDPFIYLQYGQLLFNMKKYKESAEVLKKVLTKMPNDIELLKNTANICRIAGLLSDAKKYYKEVVHLQPDATSYNALGTILYLRGEYNESKIAYQSSLKLNPDNVAVRQNLQKLKCIYNQNNSSDFDKTIK